MKYFTLIFVLIISLQINPQTKTLDSFMDIKWGSSISTVLKKISQKENINVVSKTDTFLVLSGGEFGGREVQSWQFSFWNNQFYSVTLYLSVRTPIYLDDLYFDLKRDISKKYGKPSVDDSTSYSDRTIIWEFPKQTKKQDECFILLTINSDPFFWLVLAYQNSSIFDKKLQYEKKEREEALKEL